MPFFQAGPKNLITDVAGLKVGNASDFGQRTGVTVLVPDDPAVCAVDVRGGGPGTRETDALASQSTVQHVHGLVLSGGSAFGLEAASAVQVALAAQGQGFQVSTLPDGTDVRVPIVPQAILFDLMVGDKPWLDGSQEPPYRWLANQAFSDLGDSFALGAEGAGTGATTGDGIGGLGSCSTLVDDRFTVGALVAVNAMGCVRVGDTKHFHAASFEMNKEFGGLGVAPNGAFDPSAKPKFKGQDRSPKPGTNTTIAIIATDLKLDRPALQRIAAMAHNGLARAIWPIHAPLDGDTVFVISTGGREPQSPLIDTLYAGQAAAQTLARAVARGVFEAENG